MQRIYHPAPYQAHDDWLAEFRSVEPTAEILYLGEGRWCAGSVAPSPSPEALKYVEADSRLNAAVRQGFRPIEHYDHEQLADGRAPLDFRVRDWTYQRLQQHFEELLLAQACGDIERAENVKRRIDNVASEARSIHRFCFRDSRSQVVSGFRDEPGTTLGGVAHV